MSADHSRRYRQIDRDRMDSRVLDFTNPQAFSSSVRNLFASFLTDETSAYTRSHHGPSHRSVVTMLAQKSGRAAADAENIDFAIGDSIALGVKSSDARIKGDAARDRSSGTVLRVIQDMVSKNLLALSGKNVFLSSGVSNSALAFAVNEDYLKSDPTNARRWTQNKHAYLKQLKGDNLSAGDRAHAGEWKAELDRQGATVRRQIQALRSAGANVVVSGVSDDYAGANEILAQAVRESGANVAFTGPLKNVSGDHVHPTNYRVLRQDASDAFKSGAPR